MADRSLKGTGLGAKSFEDEAGVEFAARQEVGYDCPASTTSASCFRLKPIFPLCGSAPGVARNRSVPTVSGPS